MSLSQSSFTADSSSTNAVSSSSAQTTHHFPSSRCASATKVAHPRESRAETQQFEPALLRLSAMISQYLTRCFVRLPLFAGQSQKWKHPHQKSVGQKIRNPPVSFPLFRCDACLRQRAMIRHKPPYAIRYSMRLPHFLAGTDVDNFGCTWTSCSTQSGDGWPQRSHLQPGVPSLGRCVSLLPATFCNLGVGDPLSSCNKSFRHVTKELFS